jgi:hypothetical protein
MNLQMNTGGENGVWKTVKKYNLLIINDNILILSGVGKFFQQEYTQYLIDVYQVKWGWLVYYQGL